MLSLAARLAPALCLPLVLSACGTPTEGGESDEGPVVASFYPLAWVAERVAGDNYDVLNLTAPGAEPHDLELGITQTAGLQSASLIVFAHGMQPAVDAAVDNVSESTVIDAAEVVDLIPLAEHGDEETHEDDHGDEHGDADPHFWLDPLRMADLADAVADELGDLHPESAGEFTANAAEARADLERLDSAYTTGLASCERETVVVSHAAFGYLSRYGLHFEAIAGLSPDAEATPADLARLQELIAHEGITTVFSERLASSAMADSLAGDVGVKTAVLDPIEGLTSEDPHADYLSLMTENLAALQKANGC